MAETSEGGDTSAAERGGDTSAAEREQGAARKEEMRKTEEMLKTAEHVLNAQGIFESPPSGGASRDTLHIKYYELRP